MDACVILVSLLVIIIYLISAILKQKFDYWKKRNVPFIKPLPILGNYGRNILLQEYVGELMQKLCQQFPNAPYFGAFYGTEPVLVVQSPEVLKQVLSKDFYYFSGREISKYATKEVLTKSIFFGGGDIWKIIRHLLTPLFSPAKLKNMFSLTERCCHMLEDMLEYEAAVSDVAEVKDLSARYTMDCISSCVFGIEANTMLKPENNQFRFISSEIMRLSNYRGFKIIFRAIWPKIFYSLGFKCYPPSIAAFFTKLLKSVFASRNYEPSMRNDFVDLFLNLKQKDVTADSIKNTKTGLKEKTDLKLDDDILVAQCFTLFGAGYETSASTLSFTLFELAKHSDIQKRAADEVDEYLQRRGNKLDYECINELPYLEACMYETLRKYPVLGNLTREVMDNYTFADGLHLEKSVRIHIPVYSLHYNPNYFPEPEVFKPERFLEENKSEIKPYTFFPYGEGPRICIGKRLAKIMVLGALVTFLKKYRVELSSEMPQTLSLDGRSFVIQTKEKGIMLKFYEREGWEQRKFTRV